MSQTRPFRSLLFVPATRPDWVEKAVRSDADAVVIDLEDAVAEAEKPRARELAADSILSVKDAGKGIFVRINGLGTRYWLDDVRAVSVEGLTGISLPKAESAADVICVDHVLTAVESSAGLPERSIDIQPLLETAAGIVNACAILSASDRVRSFFGGSARDGDMNRDLGSRWRRDGRESLFVRAKMLLDGRASRIAFPISGTWTEVQDIEGLEVLAEESRDLGYVGMYVIHPSHVTTVNRAFTPDEAELERYRAIIEAYAESEKAGGGATMLGSSMIDKAMVDRAHEVLRLAELTTSSRTGGAR
jgi:citrate lyase subunit beta / citryl-CoA lyase